MTFSFLFLTLTFAALESQKLFRRRDLELIVSYRKCVANRCAYSLPKEDTRPKVTESSLIAEEVRSNA